MAGLLLRRNVWFSRKSSSVGRVSGEGQRLPSSSEVPALSWGSEHWPQQCPQELPLSRTVSQPRSCPPFHPPNCPFTHPPLDSRSSPCPLPMCPPTLSHKHRLTGLLPFTLHPLTSPSTCPLPGCPGLDPRPRIGEAHLCPLAKSTPRVTDECGEGSGSQAGVWVGARGQPSRQRGALTGDRGCEGICQEGE